MLTYLNLFFRFLGLVWSTIILALIGNVIAQNIDGASSATRSLIYAMYAASWAEFAVIWGALAAVWDFINFPWITLFIDTIAMLSLFVSGIVLSAKLRVVDCGNIRGQYLPNTWIAFGSSSVEKRCREIQASDIFTWFDWATFVVLMVIVIIEGRGGYRRTRASSRPAMTQARV